MKRLLPIALVAAAALLAGCSSTEPGAESTEVPDTSPVLTEEQIGNVTTDVNRVLEAVKTADADALSPRVFGPALRMRVAALELDGKSGGQFPAGALSAPTNTSTVSAGVEWPRTILELTEIPTDGQTPLLKVIRQEGAQDPFKLWAWVRLLPGATVPATLSAEVGVKEGSGAAHSAQEVVSNYVQMAPAQVGNAVVDVDDTFTAALATQVKSMTDSASASGTVVSTLSAGEDGAVEIPTAEGGAIVVATLTQTAVFQRTVAGSTFNLGGSIGALLGENKKVEGTVTATWDITVAFAVPPAVSGQKAKVIGAERVLRSVVADPSTNPDGQANQ